MNNNPNKKGPIDISKPPPGGLMRKRPINKATTPEERQWIKDLEEDDEERKEQEKKDKEKNKVSVEELQFGEIEIGGGKTRKSKKSRKNRKSKKNRKSRKSKKNKIYRK